MDADRALGTEAPRLSESELVEREQPFLPVRLPCFRPTARFNANYSRLLTLLNPCPKVSLGFFQTLSRSLELFGPLGERIRSWVPVFCRRGVFFEQINRIVDLLQNFVHSSDCLVDMVYDFF